jgi:hypothetical protein
MEHARCRGCDPQPALPSLSGQSEGRSMTKVGKHIRVENRICWLGPMTRRTSPQRRLRRSAATVLVGKCLGSGANYVFLGHGEAECQRLGIPPQAVFVSVDMIVTALPAIPGFGGGDPCESRVLLVMEGRSEAYSEPVGAIRVANFPSHSETQGSRFFAEHLSCLRSARSLRAQFERVMPFHGTFPLFAEPMPAPVFE